MQETYYYIYMYVYIYILSGIMAFCAFFAPELNVPITSMTKTTSEG